MEKKRGSSEWWLAALFLAIVLEGAARK